MTLQQLEYIIALDTYRHFGKAALHCNIAQPSLSVQIQKLEEELKTTGLWQKDMPAWVQGYDDNNNISKIMLY